MVRMLLSALLAMAISGYVVLAQSPKKLTSDAGVCSYITGHMNSVLPQVPTLCSTTRDKSLTEYLNINIFVSGNVIQGSMRRTWSSALFQTIEGVAEDTPLSKACSHDNVCLLSFADTSMSEHFWNYEVYVRSKDVQVVKDMLRLTQSDEFSEYWYEAWWNSVDKKSANQASRANAYALAANACKSFLETANERAIKYGMTAPACSTLMATASSIYIVIDFNDTVKALTGSLIADDLLPNTIARTLNNTPYRGDVVIRSPWLESVDGHVRVYRVYHLRDLQFAYEEGQSGLRSESDIQMLLITRFVYSGVTNQNHLSGDSSEGDMVIRNAAIAKVTDDMDGSQLLDTTDGAEWRVKDRGGVGCFAQVGDDILIAAPSETSVVIRNQHNGKECSLDGSFIRGW